MCAYAVLAHKNRATLKVNNRQESPFTNPGAARNSLIKSSSVRGSITSAWKQSAFTGSRTRLGLHGSRTRLGQNVIGLDIADNEVLRDGDLFKLSAKGIWQQRRILLTKDCLIVAIERPPRHKEGYVSMIASSPACGGNPASDRVYLVLEHGSISCWRSEATYKQNIVPPDESMLVRDCVIRISEHSLAGPTKGLFLLVQLEH